jgi:ubiquinone/menaquinone biosynthesis C-methylase UbiE
MMEVRMATEFRKDLSHLTWEEVFVRQQQRAFLLPAWFEGLHLTAGDHVLDLGAGPGYVSLQMASLVGPTGLVHAVDREAEALAYLQGLLRHNQVNVRCIVADILQFALKDEQVSAVLLSMMLHHSDEPAALIGKLPNLLSPESWAVIAEFHPDGPACSGPPRNVRLSPEHLEQWCQQAGLHVMQYMRQSEEHYMLTVHR